jgi:hypothetical protein
MRSITQGPRDTLDPTTALGECVDSEPLLPLVACEAIRGGQQHPGYGCQGDALPESIQTGTLEGGTAGAILTLDGRVGPIPIGMRRPVSTSTTKWLCKRLGLVVTRRGNPGGERDCQGTPPEDAMGQACCLRHFP